VVPVEVPKPREVADEKVIGSCDTPEDLGLGRGLVAIESEIPTKTRPCQGGITREEDNDFTHPAARHSVRSESREIVSNQLADHRRERRDPTVIEKRRI